MRLTQRKKLSQTIALFCLFLATPLMGLAQSPEAVPLTENLILLNAIHFEPKLFDDAIWQQLTERQIAADQAYYVARPSVKARNTFVPVFTQEQVEGRNAKIASGELAPIFKAEVLKRAAAAPRTVTVKHQLMEPRYDTATKKLISTCCYSRPRVRPGRFDLLRPAINLVNGVPSNTPAAYQPSKNFPSKARTMPLYAVKENLPGKERELGTIAGLGLVHGRSLTVRPDEMGIALDHWLEIDGIPLDQRAAETLMNQVQGPRNPVEAHVTFTVTGAEKGTPLTALYGKLVSVSIIGPTGLITTFAPSVFP